ncbi:MAG: PilN domain-containing protein [Elusimicrobiota bacterium]|jgi:type IV pilus assembly protein PilN
MIRINLLPAEIRADETRRQLAVLASAAGVLAAAGLLAVLALRINKANALQRDLVVANEELRKYEAIVQQVEQLQSTKNELQARRDIIQRLLKGRLLYPKFFEDFMSLLPAEIWVTSLTTTPQQAESLSVAVNAQSTSNFAIADWLTNLQASPYCASVELGAISAQEAEEGRAPILMFSITFKYQRSDV